MKKEQLYEVMQAYEDDIKARKNNDINEFYVAGMIKDICKKDGLVIHNDDCNLNAEFTIIVGKKHYTVSVK